MIEVTCGTVDFSLLPFIVIGKESGYRYSRTFFIVLSWFGGAIEFSLHQHQEIIDGNFKWLCAVDEPGTNRPIFCNPKYHYLNEQE